MHDVAELQVVSLAREVLKGLHSDLAKATTLVFGSIEAALLASNQLQNQIVALEDPPDEALVGPLMIVAPSISQVSVLPFLFIPQTRC